MRRVDVQASRANRRKRVCGSMNSTNSGRSRSRIGLGNCIVDRILNRGGDSGNCRNGWHSWDG